MVRAPVSLPRLLIASALIAAPAAAEAAANPNVGAVQGESTTKDHKDLLAAQSASCAATNVRPTSVASDPEEGGQVARAAAKPGPSEIKVVKTADTASTKLAEAAPSGGASCAPGRH